MVDAPNPIETFLATLATLPADAPTSCAAWTAHEVVAHLTAGVEEITELVEDVVNGVAVRPTRSFDEREAPYLAMPDSECRAALLLVLPRAFAALGALGDRGADASVMFFDRPWTAAQIAAHAGNEFAIHRWDLIGDDDLGDAMMSPPEVTASAVSTLNTLPMLDEAPTARAVRAGLVDVRVVLRSSGHPDLSLVVDGAGQAHLETNDTVVAPDGDLVITTDPVNRLLTLWGRRSTARPLSLTGDPALWPAVAHALWGEAPAWAPRLLDGPVV
jgi:uncharacterized protein (TIGR03083 family)